MNLTAFAAITGALVQLMEAGTPVAPVVFRARDRQLAEQYASAVSVQCDGSAPMSGAILGAPIDWESRFSIECWARTTTTSADLAVDPLVFDVYQRIAADTTLAGLVDDVSAPLIEFEYTAEDKKTGWVRMTYLITHRTVNSTLEVP
jgi:hypothetical protein